MSDSDLNSPSNLIRILDTDGSAVVISSEIRPIDKESDGLVLSKNASKDLSNQNLLAENVPSTQKAASQESGKSVSIRLDRKLSIEEDEEEETVFLDSSNNASVAVDQTGSTPVTTDSSATQTSTTDTSDTNKAANLIPDFDGGTSKLLFGGLLGLGVIAAAAGGGGGSSSGGGGGGGGGAIDTTAPSILSLTVDRDSTPPTITLTYDENLDSSNLPSPQDFVVTTGGSINPVSFIAISESVVTLTLENAFGPGLVNVAYNTITIDANNAIQDIAGNDAIGFSSGLLADGYIRGARVYVDTNNNGIAEEGLDYYVGPTDANGNFFLPENAPSGNFIAIGGINIDTGVVNNIPLKAPANSITINPLTTILQGVIDQNPTLSVEDATNVVLTSFGLEPSLDLTNYDPISEGDVIVQKVAAQLAIVISVAQSNADDGSDIVIRSIATQISDPVSNVIFDLADNEFIGSLLFDAGFDEEAILQNTTTIASANSNIAAAVDINAISNIQAIALDRISPAQPTLIQLEEGSDSGTKGDWLTNISTPDLKIFINNISVDGTAAVVGDTLVVRVNSNVVSSTLLSAEDIVNGYAKISLPELSDQIYSIDAKLSDKAENDSLLSTVVDLTIDTTAPTTTVAIDSITIDSGTSSTDFITNDADGLTIAATLSTALADGEKLEYSTNGTNWADITSSATGTTVSYADSSLTSSATIQMRVTDAAGNVGTAASQAIVIDTTAPTTTVTIDSITIDSGTSSTDFITNDADGLTIAATLSTALADDEKLEYSTNGTNWTDITSSATGTTVSYADSSLTSSATIQMRVTDAAGNVGTAASQAIVIDTTAPTISISTDDESLTAAETATITFTLSEASTDFTVEDVVVSGGLLSNFSGSGTTYTATFTPTADSTTDGVVSVASDKFSNAAGNFNADGSDLDNTVTMAVDTVTTPGLAPMLLESNLDDVTNFDVTSSIVLTYSEAVTAASGKYLRIINDGGDGFRGESATHTQLIEVTDESQVSIVNGTITINPRFDLDLANDYHIEIDAGAFVSVATGVASNAYDGTDTLNFSTVTPGTTSLSNAAASVEMDANGDMVSSYEWLDIEGIGSPSSDNPVSLDLSTGNYALVAKDYDTEGSDDDIGYDGISLNNLNVAANGFGAGDLIYIDDQTNNSDALNDLGLTAVIDFGTAPTKLQFAGTDLGGFIDVTLSVSQITFDSIAAFNEEIGSTAVITG
ncbi:MAG: hypothetical protein KFB94_08440 [Methylophilaceae bacterium]|nr:MAG: hypothetical protein KFB94_08440 [Methylophilaceae bacterium]